MNKFTLAFKESDMEKLFQREQHSQDIITLRRNLSLFVFVETLWGIYYIVVGIYLNVATLAAFDVILLIIYYLARRSPLWKDILIFIVEVLVILTVPLSFITHTNQKSGEIYYFVQGQSISFVMFMYSIRIMLRFLIGTRFYLKVSIIFLNFIIQILLVFEVQQTDTYPVQASFFGLYSFMAMFWIYQSDSEKRMNFMLKKIQTSWQKGLDQAVGLPYLQMELDKQSNQLKIHSINRMAQEEFKFKYQDQYLFKEFLRSYNVLSRTSKIKEEEQSQLKKCQRMNLEQYLFYLLQQPEMINRKQFANHTESIIEQPINIWLKKKGVKTKAIVFMTFDHNLVLNLFFEKKETDEQIELKRFNKLRIQKIIQELTLENMLWVSDCLVKIQRFGSGTMKQATQRLDEYSFKVEKLEEREATNSPKVTNPKVRLLMIQLEASLNKSYNSLMNAHTVFSETFYKGIVTEISMQKIMKKLRRIFRKPIGQLVTQLNLNYQTEQNGVTIYTYERLFIQLLVNLVNYSTLNSKRNSQFKIKVGGKTTDHCDQPVLELYLSDDGARISQRRLDYILSIENQPKLESASFSSDCWGLVASSYIVGLIGPTNLICFHQGKNEERKISFKIYQDLRQLGERRLSTNILQPNIQIK